MSCPLRTSGHVACTLGRFPEMSLNVAPASVDLYTRPPAASEAFSPSDPSGAKYRDALAPSVTYTVFGSFGSGVTPVMIRFGRPAAFAMCQPSLVPILGGFGPPTFVAKPLLKTRWRFTGSQSPQNPT